MVPSSERSGNCVKALPAAQPRWLLEQLVDRIRRDHYSTRTGQGRRPAHPPTDLQPLTVSSFRWAEVMGKADDLAGDWRGQVADCGHPVLPRGHRTRPTNG